jgi:hypothetical protein
MNLNTHTRYWVWGPVVNFKRALCMWKVLLGAGQRENPLSALMRRLLVTFVGIYKFIQLTAAHLFSHDAAPDPRLRSQNIVNQLGDTMSSF